MFFFRCFAAAGDARRRCSWNPPRALWPGLLHRPSEVDAEEDEEGYCISLDSGDTGACASSETSREAGFDRFATVASAPSAFYFFVGDFHFWKTLVLFFTKAAFVTIGGSYTVIPYVAQVTVWKMHWLSSSQMTDGFALAETTPGPLIIVVAFVGFMAGYNHFHGSLWMGTLGPGSNNVLHLSTVFSLCLCRRAAS